MRVRLFAGDDWAEDHHDVELMDAAGRVLARARLSEGVAGIAGFHGLVAAQLGDGDEAEVIIGTETGRGPWVGALSAAGYRVLAVNPLQAARFRDRHAVSGAKSDRGDAHALADMARTDAHQLRPVAADSDLAQAIQVVARAHKRLIWERTRHTQRLRHQLREYFPAALAAFPDLDAAEALELLAKAPEPATAAKLTKAQLAAALKRAGRRDIPGRVQQIRAALAAPALGAPPLVTAAYAATVRSLVAMIRAAAEQARTLEGQVEAHFGRHPDAEIYRSQPGLGAILGARVLAEFGDDPGRYASAKARRNYAGTSPVTRASGKKRTVAARHVRNDWLTDALMSQAFTALRTSPGARAFYDTHRARGLGHNAALRHLANHLVGILHGCLKTRTTYNEHTAWAHRSTLAA